MDSKNPSVSKKESLAHLDVIDMNILKELPEAKHPRITNKKKIMLTLLVVFSITVVVGIIPLTIFLMKRGKFEVDSYRETQYDLLVKPTILVSSHNKVSTTHDSFHVTLFALDMEGEKYRFLITNASMEIRHINSTNVPLKSDYFIYLELESNSGKILMSKYKEELFEQSTVNLLIGITQVFVVDQDSEMENSSNCKKKYKDGNECSLNSKRKFDEYTLFEKFESSNNDASENDAEYENSATTWVNNNGKVEKCEIKGWFSKKLDSESPDDKINFNVSASVEVANSYKLEKSQVNQLNKLVEDLPEVNQKRDYNTTTYDEFTEDNEDDDADDDYDDDDDDENHEEIEDDFHENLFILDDDRSLNNGEERKLMSSPFNFDYFTFYSIPFKLSNIIYSKIDEKNKVWLCGIHKFVFSQIEVKLLKKDFCISSHLATPVARKKVKKLVQKKSSKNYLTQITFSVFTFKLDGKVKVKDTPYLETTYDNNLNLYTKLDVNCKITVKVTGEAKSGASKAGITFKNTMESYLGDFMFYYNSPFYALVETDRSHKASFEIWIKKLGLDAQCFDIFGVNICLPTFVYNKKKIVYEEDFAYEYFPVETIYGSSFTS